MVTKFGYKNMSKIYCRSPCKSFESGLRLIILDKGIPMMLEDNQLKNAGGEDFVGGEDTESGDGSLGGEETVSGKKNIGGDEENDEDSVGGGYEKESDVNSMDYINEDNDELIKVRQKLQRLMAGKGKENEVSEANEPTEHIMAAGTLEMK
ncbi:hypothetical protein LguiA_017944 [Lonicera macranthoides]